MELKELKTYFDTCIPFTQGVALLGLGREGLSSYRFLRGLYPQMPITVLDANVGVTQLAELENDPFLYFEVGADYLRSVAQFALVLKTPGISLKDNPSLLHSSAMSSQTDLFLRLFGAQCVGVTGTKGKTTTTYLIYHLLKEDFPCLLAGNMGIPFFDILPQLKPETKVVCELSSHQLEQVRTSPRLGVLLNLFQEHLDHYLSFKDYQQAKMHIAGGQYFVFNAEDSLIRERLEESIWSKGKSPSLLAWYTQEEREASSFTLPTVQSLHKKGKALYSNQGELVFDFTHPHPLIGSHNEINLAMALLTGRLMGGNYARMALRVASFEPLPHRLQYVGCYKGIHFFNDSISTIPQACIAAIESVRSLSFVQGVGCLILGGFDRKIDYEPLVDYLCVNPIKNIIFVGLSGERIYEMLKQRNALPENVLRENDYTQVVVWAKDHTPQDQACLLSPAAASYDSFKNFEERGTVFMRLVKEV